MVSKIFYFHPYLGKLFNLTNIFELGWDYQLDHVEPSEHLDILGILRSPPMANILMWNWWIWRPLPVATRRKNSFSLTWSYKMCCILRWQLIVVYCVPEACTVILCLDEQHYVQCREIIWWYIYISCIYSYIHTYILCYTYDSLYKCMIYIHLYIHK